MADQIQITVFTDVKQSVTAVDGLSKAFKKAEKAAQKAQDRLKATVPMLSGVANRAEVYAARNHKAFLAVVNDYGKAAEAAKALAAQRDQELAKAARVAKQKEAEAARAAKAAAQQQRAAAKQAAAAERLSAALVRQKGYWGNLGGQIRQFLTVSRLANETFRIMRLNVLHLTSGMVRLGIQSATVSSNFLGFRNALQIASGSLDEANNSIQTAESIANNLGLNITSVTKEYSKFVNAVTLAGKSTEFADKSFKQFAVTARVLNLNAEETSGMFLALEQMVSKGTVSMEELRRQLGQHLPGAVALAGKAMGYAKEDLGDFYDEVKKGAVSSDELIENLGNLLAKRTAPLLEQALKKSTVAITRFWNEVTKLQITIGNNLQPAVVFIIDKFTGLLKVFRSLLPETALLSSSMESTATSVEALRASVEPVTVALNAMNNPLENAVASIAVLGVTGASAAKSLQLFGKTVSWLFAPLIALAGYAKRASMMLLLLARLNPITAALTAAGAAIAYFVSSSDDAVKSSKTFVESIEKAEKALVDYSAAAELARTQNLKLDKTFQKEENALTKLGLDRKIAVLQLQVLEQQYQQLVKTLDIITTAYKKSAGASLELQAAMVAQAQIMSEAQDKIKAVKQQITNYDTVLKAFSKGLEKVNKVKKKTVSLTEKATEAFNTEKTLLRFIIDDYATAADETTKYQLAKQGWNDTQIKSIMLLREEADMVKKLTEWKKEQDSAIESPDKGPFSNFDKTPMQTFLEDAPDMVTNLENVYINAFQNMGDALTEFVTTGKMDFKSLARSVIADLTRMIIKQMMFNAMSSIFGGGGSILSAAAPAQIALPGGSTGFINTSGVAKFAKGTNNVPQDGLAYLHKGEAVIPASANNTTNNYTNTTEKPVSIVNVTDSSMVYDAMSGSMGEEVIINTIRRNPELVRQVIA